MTFLKNPSKRNKRQGSDVSVESYKHKCAKQVLCNWFREASKTSDYGTTVCGLSFRSNRGAPYYGVHEEYPIEKSIVSDGYVYPWDEFWPLDPEDWSSRPPTREELLSVGKNPDCILDVAIQHKGSIIYAFEIVHRNPVADWKAELLDKLDILTYEVNAEWIMCQVGTPEKIVYTRVFGKDSWRVK